MKVKHAIWPVKANSQAVKLARSIHIYTSVLMLFVLCFFAITGITLNHANWVGEPVITKHTWTISSVEDTLNKANIQASVEAKTNFAFADATIEQDEGLWLIDAQLAGEQWQLEIDGETKEVVATHIDYGWMAKLNDWHKGRHTPKLWNWMLDVMAVIIVIFCLSGLWLLLPNKKKLLPVFLWGTAGTVLWLLTLL
ncbi:PepSY-associated TM helix domain-containing protein [Pseudoalteromonas xiamenensis]